MMRSGRKPDRMVTSPVDAGSVAEATIESLAFELVHLEGDAHVEAVPVDDSVREDFPLRDAVLGAEGIQARHLVGEVIDADAVHAGIEPEDAQALDHYSVGNCLDRVVA